MDIGKTPQGGLIYNYRKGMMEWIIASMTIIVTRSFFRNEQEIEEINNVKMSLLNTLVTKLNNAGIYFNSTSRIKSESSLLHKLETGKYSMQEGGRKIQDIIGIRINLFYLEDMDI